jgi:hypothetical protein
MGKIPWRIFHETTAAYNILCKERREGRETDQPEEFKEVADET